MKRPNGTKVTIKTILLIVVATSTQGCWTACGERVEGEFPSPDGEYLASVFERDCGATTDFSSAVRVRSRGSEFRGEEIVFLVAGSRDIKVTWADNSTLKVGCDACTENEIFKKEDHWNKVRILY